MLFPTGRSTYGALLVSLKATLGSPVRGMKHLSLTVHTTPSTYLADYSRSICRFTEFSCN